MPGRSRISTPGWLLLVHQLPAEPAALRVKTWRRLRELGAVAVKNSVYALPDRGEAREDFEWVRADIVGAGGQATVFQASTIDAKSDAEIRELHRRDRKEDYARFTADTTAQLRRIQREKKPIASRAFEKAVRAGRAALDHIERLDVFGAEGRASARAALSRLEAVGAAASHPKAPAATRLDNRLNRADYQAKRWMTRPRPGIDRMASAWLIRRFVDSHARFVFGQPGSRRTGAVVTFDMFDGDFTHEGDRCTFEVLCLKFGLRDSRLVEIAEIVHDLDLKDGRFGRAEATVLGAMVEGLRRLYRRDEALLEHGIELFEVLYTGNRE